MVRHSTPPQYFAFHSRIHTGTKQSYVLNLPNVNPPGNTLLAAAMHRVACYLVTARTSRVQSYNEWALAQSIQAQRVQSIMIEKAFSIVQAGQGP